VKEVRTDRKVVLYTTRGALSCSLYIPGYMSKSKKASFQITGTRLFVYLNPALRLY
jgi:hypothetical protein